MEQVRVAREQPGPEIEQLRPEDFQFEIEMQQSKAAREQPKPALEPPEASAPGPQDQTLYASGVHSGGASNLDIMDKKLFDRLVGSMEQMGEIVRGERAPSREFHVDAVEVREIRKATGLSQQKFAGIIRVHVATLQNWEQGRRAPTGPAKALLRAIKNDPVHVISALTEGSA
ncbi:helix-turn-helix domain-containing protein [Lysobacter sp. KIS68-7]|uniref:helix-turn-helix domain-containing protein n=1 Tax=Lysobacter sp. KIS68-7 TaxID=2904252 RepID=UPI001E43F762|nr:helix-turn-helix domain-containing protein [Lysobacter sp. KIS68-7]UHQ18808.1 helix-turn-helix domain-containing protein [Lysobacter sp. KIS68-7]